MLTDAKSFANIAAVTDMARELRDWQPDFAA
jgi:hypothetical protein